MTPADENDSTQRVRERLAAEQMGSAFLHIDAGRGLVGDSVWVRLQQRPKISRRKAYLPWIVHIHAWFFTGWLVLFTSQMILVRRDRVSTHRRLGMSGAGRAAAMVVLGVLTAIVTEQVKFGTPASDPPFLSVMFADMLVFGVLVASAMRARRSPAAHKRLMLIATLVLTDAGFGRWLSPKIVEWTGQRNYWELKTFGEAAWPLIRFQLVPAYTLIAAVGAFDLFTQQRLHLAYVRAIAWSLPIHVLAGWLYFQPFWKSASLRIAGP